MRLGASISQAHPFPPQAPLVEASPQGPPADAQAMALVQPAGQPIHGPDGRGKTHPERLVAQFGQHPSASQSGSLARATAPRPLLEILDVVAAQKAPNPAVNRQIMTVEALGRLAHFLSTGDPLHSHKALVEPRVAGLACRRAQTAHIAGFETPWLGAWQAPHAANLNPPAF